MAVTKTGVRFEEDTDALRVSSIADARERGEGNTAYERKCILINREIDAMGMGKYQWYIFFLCGAGYLIDLMWAQSFGLVLAPLQQELGFSGPQSANISTSFSAGLTAGAAFWGILVDLVGRRWAFNLTVLFSSVFGLALGGANSYTAFLVLTAFVGFGVGGNIPIDTTITLEFIPQSKRRLLPFLSVFQPVGVVVTTAIAYGLVPRYSCTPSFTEGTAQLPSCNMIPTPSPCCGRKNNMGWRYLLFTIGAITFGIFLLRFVVFRFQESPKYLISRGKDEKAIAVLHKMAEFNKQECTLTLRMFEDLCQDHGGKDSEANVYDDEAHVGQAEIPGHGKWSRLTRGSALERSNIKAGLSRYALLFSTPTMARLTILIWLTYACDFFGFTVAGFYLPNILALRNGALHLSLQYTYRSYVYIYLPGIVAVLIGVFCYDFRALGRKWTMVFSSGLMGASLFIFTTVNSQASNIGLNVLEYVFQTIFNAVLYGWTPESYPAPIRGTACGVASFWGRLFGIVGPQIAGHLLPAHPEVADYQKVLYLAGGVTLGCVVWTALLPNKLIGKQSM